MRHRPNSRIFAHFAAVALAGCVFATSGCAGGDSAGTSKQGADTVGDAHAADVGGDGIGVDGNGASDDATLDAGPGTHGISAVAPAEGPTAGLTSVEITGHGLSTATTVWFGESKALDLDIVDDTHLRCRTPPHPADNVEVRILRMDGDVVQPELALDFAYRYVPTITVLSVDPPQGPTTGGLLVTVRGSGFVPGTQFIFGDRLAIASQIEDEFSATMFLPPGAPGLAAVTAANSDGQARIRDAFTYVQAAAVKKAEGVTLAWFEPGLLDPKGGTAAKLRYTAPDALGPLLGVRIGPLSAASLGPGPQGKQSLTMVAPAGSPGPADVALLFA